MKIIIPAFVISICVGAYFLYISPISSQVKALNIKKAEYADVLLKSQELKTKRDSLLANYSKISSDDIDRLNKVIPETFNPILFANDMNVLVANDGLIIKDFSVSQPVSENREDMTVPQSNGPFTTSVITFRLIGKYEQFLKFLTDIESSARLMDVTKLTISSSGSNSSSSTSGSGKTADDSLSYLLEINTYSLK